MYLQAVSRSSGAISDQQLAEIEKRKEEVKQVTRAGSVRDSRNLFESGDAITLGSLSASLSSSIHRPSLPLPCVGGCRESETAHARFDPDALGGSAAGGPGA